MSLTMIRQGYAWPYYQYFYRLSPKERAAYKKAALLAKPKGAGFGRKRTRPHPGSGVKTTARSLPALCTG